VNVGEDLHLMPARLLLLLLILNGGWAEAITTFLQGFVCREERDCVVASTEAGPSMGISGVGDVGSNLPLDPDHGPPGWWFWAPCCLLAMLSRHRLPR